ncbi:MAG: ATP-binding protein [Xanthomonadales bacterium]|nr:ATP-binding protein [Xanthomonadales bacterium]
MRGLGRHLKRFLQKILPIVSVLVLLFAALYLAGSTTTSIGELGDIYLLIFVATGLALLVLAMAIINRIFKLVRQLRTGAAGSKLTMRLVLVFVALAVPPAIIVYWFSVDFLSRSVDSWFDVDVETALEDAEIISQSFLEVQEQTRRNQIERQARRLMNSDGRNLISELTDLVQESGALEMAVFQRGRILATSSTELGRMRPDLPDELDLRQARNFGVHVHAEPVGDGGLQIRALAEIPQQSLGAEPRILQAIFPVTPGFDERAANVQRQLARYTQLAYLRDQLKRSFVLILSLVLLLSVLLAVLLAFDTARRLVMPIGRLSAATRAVAAGDYRSHIDDAGDDELGFLVRSFNAMTDEIASASHAAEQSRQEAEQRRDYLEAVLGRLSSAVLSLDAEGRLLTANAATDRILGLRTAELIGARLAKAVGNREDLTVLVNLIEAKGQAGEREWRDELTLETGDRQQVLVCRGAQLTTASNVGQVVVIDDVTDLVQAQRAAAWGEVARRLAHEVRNPLTPIQLAAERIRHKYLGRLEAEDDRVLDKTTRTIVAQVEALKTMVNAFSEYARAPTLQLEKVKLSDLVEDVLELYRHGAGALSYQADWMDPEPRVLVDCGRIRQLLHNLIKNAQEALEDKDLSLNLDTHLYWRDERPWLVFSLRDNGPGVPRQIIDKLFEPYATTKTRGTGIGLAIVKKIAEEHGGAVRARNAESGGAVIEVELPVEPREIAALEAPPTVGADEKSA